MAGGGMGAGAPTTQSTAPTTQGSAFGMSTPSTMPTQNYNQQMPAFLQNRGVPTGQPQPGQFGYGGSDYGFRNAMQVGTPNIQAAQVPQAQRGFSPEAHAAMMRHRELIQQARNPAPAPVQQAPVQQAPRQPYRESAEDRAYRQQTLREKVAREESARQAGLRSIEGLGLNFNENLTNRSNVSASVPMAQQNMTLAQRKAFENEARRMR